MNKIKKIVAVASLVVFTMGSVGCNMVEKTPEAIARTTVAKVGDKKITKGEVDSHYGVSSYIEQFKQKYGENFAQNPEVKEQLKQIKLKALQEITTEEIFAQEAKNLKLEPKEEEIKKEITEFKKQQNIKDDKALEEFLKTNKLTKKDFDGIVKNNIVYKKIEKELTKDVKITDKEIQEYYNKYKDNYPKDSKKPTKLHLAHIIILAKTAEQEKQAESEIKSIKAELDKGADFKELAKKYSQDGSRDKGGDLGEVSVVNSGMDQDFMNAAIELKEGQISGIVRTQFGYHIIKNIKKISQPVKELKEVKEEIKNLLLNKSKNKVMIEKFNAMKKKANIKIYEEKLL